MDKLQRQSVDNFALNEKNGFQISNMSIESYIAFAQPIFDVNGFFEKEIARKTEIFGAIAQVLSAYETRLKKSDSTPCARGINSFQMFCDGSRWYISSALWFNESSAYPIPDRYLT